MQEEEKKQIGLTISESFPSSENFSIIFWTSHLQFDNIWSISNLHGYRDTRCNAADNRGNDKNENLQYQ